MSGRVIDPSINAHQARKSTKVQIRDMRKVFLFVESISQ